MQVGISDRFLHMAQPASISQVWLQKGSPKSKEWTIMRLCTGDKDEFHKASFGHCRIQALGGASHGCQE